MERGHPTGWRGATTERKADPLTDGRQLQVPISGGTDLDAEIPERPWGLVTQTGKLPTKVTGHL